MRSIARSTDAFEKWMRKRTDVADDLLKKKHRRMAEGPFPFLRATFYRWVEQWPAVCPWLAMRDQDVVLAVGDLHVENFGVWRDSRKQLVWGVNDFDDACELPFTSDLVRLATSLVLAAADATIEVSVERICALVLDGYRSALRDSGTPILIADHPSLATLTRGTRQGAKKFWSRKLDPTENPEVAGRDLPKGLEDMFAASFRSHRTATYREQKAPGGLGSLGRRRFTAVLTSSTGVLVAREAKALVPSALYWWTGQDDMRSQTATLLQHAIRIPDPYFQVHDRWLIRQLAPDVAKIDLPTDPGDKRLALAADLLVLMGQETANIHLGSLAGEELEKRLRQLGRDGRWFSAATELMASSIRADHGEWAGHRQHRRR